MVVNDKKTECEICGKIPPFCNCEEDYPQEIYWLNNAFNATIIKGTSQEIIEHLKKLQEESD